LTLDATINSYAKAQTHLAKDPATSEHSVERSRSIDCHPIRTARSNAGTLLNIDGLHQAEFDPPRDHREANPTKSAFPLMLACP
jgi:hypothetical protein